MMRKWFSSHYDDYDTFLRAGSAGELARQRGMEQVGFWRKLSSHPAYDNFWSEQAMDQVLARQPVTVPTMLVHSCGMPRISMAHWPSTRPSSRWTG
jgi:hypothetical protein